MNLLLVGTMSIRPFDAIYTLNVIVTAMVKLSMLYTNCVRDTFIKDSFHKGHQCLAKTFQVLVERLL